MRKKPSFFLILFFLLSLCSSASAQKEMGGAYYDFGVFAYQDGDYEDAEKNFRKALEFEPGNPFYAHYMGKTYLKTERYKEAMTYLSQAMKADPDIAGLKYDMAFIKYKTADYAEAAALFKAVAEKEPSNVLAYYYAGIALYKQGHYKDAQKYLSRAAEKSPNLQANAYYHEALCYQRMGEIRKALDKFAYVKDHADSESLRENAGKWIQAISEKEKAAKPYSLFLKIARRYDDNVQLEPTDTDTYADEGDSATIAYFSGRYQFIDRESLAMGAGYSHYQTWYDDLSEYDLTGSLFNIYTRYRLYPFNFGLSYLPSYYWADGESYLRRHQFRPDIIMEISDILTGRFSYTYSKDDYLQNEERNGHSDEFSLDLYCGLPNAIGILSGGLTYEKASASHPDYDYSQLKANLGISLHLPWGMNMDVSGRYYDKKYDNSDSVYSVERDDSKYNASVSLSRSLFYDWLELAAEFGYTKNDSNIKDYDYEKKVTTLSLTAKYQ
ncbi:MAG: hypothetical protein BWK80_17340 [Desulfobacteraceae bacterium IS3]|nr:MAG: hypothetical protein BWK80_17340 [Desulfobacteraceae bacterium IS3]